MFIYQMPFIFVYYRPGQTGKAKKKRVPADDVQLEPEQTAHYLQWLMENDAIWKRGSGKYKNGHKLWREYAAEHGLKANDLGKWYKNKRDTYVKKILSRTDTTKT